MPAVEVTAAGILLSQRETTDDAPPDRWLCAMSTRTLTRRANQGHKDIIANIVKPARRNPRRAFSFPFFESDDDGASRRHISMPDAARRKRAVVRTTFTVNQPARANAPASLPGADGPWPQAAPDDPGDKVRAEMIAVSRAICRKFNTPSRASEAIRPS
ncbi:hypothetical protein CWO90_03955 [Bradyrhizobium sp. Leo121]|nr:hypothetical protein CWO90_03955 [Bradyrhizobium sp. Leo121]